MSCRSVPSARARATASAFSSPLTRNHTDRLRLRAPKVRVIRSGGGLGESVTPTAIRSSTSSCGAAGEQRRDVAVGTDARASRRRTTPAPCSRSSSPYAAAAVVDVSGAVAVEGISCTLAGSKRQQVEEASPAPARALRSSESGATNRSSPHQTTTRLQSTSDSARDPGELAVHGLGDGAAGERRSAVPRRRPGRPPSRVISSPAAAVARSAASTWTSMRGRGGGRVGHDNLFFAKARATCGVDVVLVEATQLLGEQLGISRRFSAIGRSGRSGDENVASLPSAPTDPDRPQLGLHDDLGDPGPCGVLPLAPGPSAGRPARRRAGRRSG